MSLTEAEVWDLNTVDFFNKHYPPGTPVRFWPGVKDGEGILSRTRSKAQILSGDTPVVWVEDYAGAIALTHVQVVEVAS